MMSCTPSVAPNGLLCGHSGHATGDVEGEAIGLLGEFLASAAGENFANRLVCSPASAGPVLFTLCRGDDDETGRAAGASGDVDRGGGDGGEATPVSAAGTSPLASLGCDEDAGSGTGGGAMYAGASGGRGLKGMMGSRRFGEGFVRFGDADDFEIAAVEFLEVTAPVEELAVCPRSVLRFSARTLSSSTILLCPANREVSPQTCRALILHPKPYPLHI